MKLKLYTEKKIKTYILYHKYNKQIHNNKNTLYLNIEKKINRLSNTLWIFIIIYYIIVLLFSLHYNIYNQLIIHWKLVYTIELCFVCFFLYYINKITHH
jgi:uncharacterized membrane protein